MAYHLGEYVRRGEIDATQPYMTYGTLVLRGKKPDAEVHIALELTGICSRDLQGKRIRFQCDAARPPENPFLSEEHTILRLPQIGVTGTMTSQGWVRTFDCSVDEFLTRSRLGEPPPTAWKRHLYLEWFGQNGRALVELGGACVEECVRKPEGEGDEGDWAELPNLALPPNENTPAAPDVTVVRLDGDEAHIEHIPPEEVLRRTEEDDDSIPGSLQQQFDDEAAAIDRAIGGATPEPDEWETPGVINLVQDTSKLPRPEDLNDRNAEIQLKVQLARLAILGVSLVVCEHFTPRDCYRLLLQKIFPKEEEFVKTGGAVQRVMTRDFCAQCGAKT